MKYSSSVSISGESLSSLYIRFNVSCNVVRSLIFNRSAPRQNLSHTVDLHRWDAHHKCEFLLSYTRKRVLHIGHMIGCVIWVRLGGCHTIASDHRTSRLHQKLFSACRISIVGSKFLSTLDLYISRNVISND